MPICAKPNGRERAHSSIALTNLGLDVDHPDDLAELLRLDHASRSGRFLRRLGVPERLEAG